MTLLKDDELKKLIAAEGIVRGFRSPIEFRADSPLQSASVDFSVGHLYSPRSPERVRESMILGQGETAVVVTAESFNLPADIGAITFPPSRLAFKGLLVTNPGHVDPGFVGPMRFAVINMAKEAAELRSRDLIATVLFFKLAGAATRPFSEGVDMKQYSAVTREQVERLSADFLSVDARASSIARAEVERIRQEVTTKLTRWTSTIAAAALIPFFLVLIGLLTPLWPPASGQALNDLKERVVRLEAALAGMQETPVAGVETQRSPTEGLYQPRSIDEPNGTNRTSPYE